VDVLHAIPDQKELPGQEKAEENGWNQPAEDQLTPVRP
jgi:hypothetical protein